jgi:hypothetical protein
MEKAFLADQEHKRRKLELKNLVNLTSDDE